LGKLSAPQGKITGKSAGKRIVPITWSVTPVLTV
jgi:hypothetical protein